MDPALECCWHDDQGYWWLQVQRSGDGWEFEAGSPFGTETLPFAGPDEVRRLAQALVDLPAEPVPYEFGWDLDGPGVDAAGVPQPTGATLYVGLCRQGGYHPYLAYQSFYQTGLGPTPGLEVICGDVPVDDLRAQARALLADLPRQ